MKFTTKVSLTTPHPKAVGYRPHITYHEQTEPDVHSVAVTGMEGDVWEFWCFIEESVERIHRHHLKPGARFSLQEGSNIKGDGVVLKVSEG